jgi:hypothetical protein
VRAALLRAAATSVLVVFGVVVGFLIAEALVRVLLPPPETITIEHAGDAAGRLAAENRERKEVIATQQFSLERAGLLIQTPTGLRMRANTVARIREVPGTTNQVVITTNALGYRNPEIGPKTRTRVLFLGDSITISDYLPEEASFVRRVQALSEAGGGEPLETINAAVTGIGLENELAILRETGLGTAPDVVEELVRALPGARAAVPPPARDPPVVHLGDRALAARAASALSPRRGRPAARPRRVQRRNPVRLQRLGQRLDRIRVAAPRAAADGFPAPGDAPRLHAAHRLPAGEASD